METSNQVPARLSQNVPGGAAQPSMSPEDADTVAMLYQTCPTLCDDFQNIVTFMDLVRQDSWAYEKLYNLLHKISSSLNDEDNVIINMSQFAVAVGFVDITVEFYRQIMREKEMSYVTEIVFPNSAFEVGCLYEIRNIFINASNHEDEFRLRLAQTGFLADMLADIVHLKHLTSECLEAGNVFDWSIGIICNCSRHEAVLPIVRGLGMVEHLVPFLAKGNQKIKAYALQTLGFIVTDADLDLIKMDDDILHFFLDCGHKASASESRSYNSFTIDEILFALSQFARNEFNNRQIVVKGGLNLIIPVLQNGTDVEKHSAMAAIVQLSKLPDNMNTFTTQTGLRQVLENLQTADDQTLRDNAARLLALVQKEQEENAFTHILKNRTNILDILDCSKVKFVLSQLHLNDWAGRHCVIDTSRTQLMQVLAELAKDDNHKTEIISLGGLELVEKSLQGETTEEKAEAVAVLLELSSNAEQRLVIQAHARLLKLVSELRQSDNTKLSQTALRTLAAFN